MKYTLLFVEEKKWYSVSVLELPGCISEWDTKNKAIKNITEAIELYLESMSDIAKMKIKSNKKISIDSIKLDYETI